ncbi:MAG: secondary thiamine-phosphate synthase enzyme YjbQ [Spirochaetia bacterium]|nr:secondary thiamine-phosphate synthase enzyme YjbQ [Spirochaetia bacterium]
MKSFHQIIFQKTQKNFEIIDITESIRNAVQVSGIQTGIVSVSSLHTTTAVFINEFESRLLQDIETFFKKLAPPGQNYLHDDIQLRDCPADEPENAHSHLMAMMFGNSESVALNESKLILGQYQSIMLVELDGPRSRSVSVQIMGQ